MNKYDWQRLKNLSLFKLWVTDRELNRFWPFAVVMAFIILVITAARWVFSL
jgi:hypothetical protein